MKKHIRKNKDGMKSEDNLLYLFVSGIEERTQGIKLQEGNLPLPLIMSLYIHIAKPQLQLCWLAELALVSVNPAPTPTQESLFGSCS